MQSRLLASLGALLAGIGVAIGAVGSHSLPKYLEKKGFDEAKVELRLEQCETAVKYQLFHALSMFAIGISSLGGRAPKLAGGLMSLGIVLFSGGIYGIVFAEAPTHWFVPFGGLAFIAAWSTLAIGVYMNPRPPIRS
jgi:uncharacterized membrane protein YgdD (TMEM256/DUF423 family)